MLTYRAYKLTILLVEGIEHAGPEYLTTGGYTWCIKVRLDHRMIRRVELEDNHVANIRGEVARHILVRV